MNFWSELCFAVGGIIFFFSSGPWTLSPGWVVRTQNLGLGFVAAGLFLSGGIPN